MLLYEVVSLVRSGLCSKLSLYEVTVNRIRRIYMFKNIPIKKQTNTTLHLPYRGHENLKCKDIACSFHFGCTGNLVIHHLGMGLGNLRKTNRVEAIFKLIPMAHPPPPKKNTNKFVCEDIKIYLIYVYFTFLSLCLVR